MNLSTIKYPIGKKINSSKGNNLRPNCSKIVLKSWINIRIWCTTIVKYTAYIKKNVCTSLLYTISNILEMYSITF